MKKNKEDLKKNIKDNKLETKKNKEEKKKSKLELKKIKKENKKKAKKEVDKSVVFKRRFKVVFIISLIIIISELVVMYFINLNRESQIKYIDNYYSIKNYDDYYLALGSSNFKYSKYNDIKIYEYKDLNEETQPLVKAYAEQAKLVKLDKELNTIFESTFECDFDSTFYDAIIKDQDIYVVGSYVYNEEQVSSKTRDALLAKYNKDGKMEWFKNFQILGDTEFKKIILADDGLIVVGQSIYENMQIGTHDMGGAIILKYDFDGNIIWKNNFGGNKSGIFNDIVKVDDGYIAVGKDAANYGMIAKFTFDGYLLWVKNYANTDEYGFSRAFVKDDKIYIAGAFNTSDEKDEEGNIIFEYDAAIFVYDLNGELVDLYSIGGSKLDRFNSLLLLDNSILAVGCTKSSDIEISGIKNTDLEDTIDGMIVEFDYSGKILETKSYAGKKNESLNDIIEAILETENLINNTKNYIVVGYSNSKIKVFKGNGKDYFSKVIKFDNKLNIIDEK